MQLISVLAQVSRPRDSDAWSPWGQNTQLTMGPKTDLLVLERFIVIFEAPFRYYLHLLPK